WPLAAFQPKKLSGYGYLAKAPATSARASYGRVNERASQSRLESTVVCTPPMSRESAVISTSMLSFARRATSRLELFCHSCVARYPSHASASSPAHTTSTPRATSGVLIIRRRRLIVRARFRGRTARRPDAGGPARPAPDRDPPIEARRTAPPDPEGCG